jgi:hypothetical protein
MTCLPHMQLGSREFLFNSLCSMHLLQNPDDNDDFLPWNTFLYLSICVVSDFSGNGIQCLVLGTCSWHSCRTFITTVCVDLSVLDEPDHMRFNLVWHYLFCIYLFCILYILFCKGLKMMGSDNIHTASCTKCTCPVLNALRAGTPFCLEYPPKGFSQRVDMWDKNGVFVPRAFKQGWWMSNFMKSGLNG